MSAERPHMKRVHPCWDVFLPGWNEISEVETPVTERHLSESACFYFVLSPTVTVARSVAHTRLSRSTVNVSVIVSHSLSDALPPSLPPFSSPLPILGQKDVEGRRGCWKKSKAVIPWIAALPWWSNCQARQGLEDIPHSCRFFFFLVIF